MSDRLYYNDAYTTAFTTTVREQVEVNDTPAAILEQTYFYPEGGGQPADVGQVNQTAVVDVQVRKVDNAVLHILEQPLQSEQVQGEVDWIRRFDHMQQHTGQHILTQAFVQEASANTVGFHLSDRTLTIDLEKGDISIKKLDRVERLANQILFENRSVTARLYPAEALPDTVRVRKIPESMSTDGVRVIEVTEFDATACGGTHVSATGEIGVLKIIGTQPYKGGTRVDFACGWRAVADYQSKNLLMQKAGALLSAKYTDVPDLIASLQQDLKQKHNQLQATMAQLTAYRAQEIVNNTPIENNVRIVILVDPELDAQLLAAKLTEASQTIALLGRSGEKAHVIAARSGDLAQNMNPVLQSIFAELGGGRGGGRPTMAQGGGITASSEQLLNALQTVAKSLR